RDRERRLVGRMRRHLHRVRARGRVLASGAPRWIVERLTEERLEAVLGQPATLDEQRQWTLLLQPRFLREGVGFGARDHTLGHGDPELHLAQVGHRTPSILSHATGHASARLSTWRDSQAGPRAPAQRWLTSAGEPAAGSESGRSRRCEPAPPLAAPP